MKNTKQCRADIYTFIKENIGPFEGVKRSSLSDLLKEYAKTVTEVRDKEKLDLSQRVEELKQDIINLKNKLEKKIEATPTAPSRPAYKRRDDRPYFNHDFLNKG